MILRLMIVANGEMLWERRISSEPGDRINSEFDLEQALLKFAAEYPDGQIQLVVRAA